MFSAWGQKITVEETQIVDLYADMAIIRVVYLHLLEAFQNQNGSCYRVNFHSMYTLNRVIQRILVSTENASTNHSHLLSFTPLHTCSSLLVLYEHWIIDSMAESAANCLVVDVARDGSRPRHATRPPPRGAQHYSSRHNIIWNINIWY